MNKLLLRRLPINLQRYDRYKYVCSNFIHDDCSQESKKTIASKSQIYDGPFSTKLKWLKRFSVTSSVFSVTIFPYLGSIFNFGRYGHYLIEICEYENILNFGILRGARSQIKKMIMI